MWWGTNASCAAPPTAPAISISLEMHRWRQSRPDFPLFGGGGKLRRILHGSRAKIYSKSAWNPRISGAFMVLQPTRCLQVWHLSFFCHRHVLYTDIAGALLPPVRRLGIPAAVSHPFPICLHSAKAPGLFCGYPCPVVSGGQPAWPPFFKSPPAP